MTAYFIAHGTVADQAKMDEYVRRSSPIVERFGGEWVSTGFVKNVLVGSHDHSRTAIFRFPSVEAISDWFNSDDYKTLWPLRAEAGDFVFLAIDEVASPAKV